MPSKETEATPIEIVRCIYDPTRAIRIFNLKIMNVPGTLAGFFARYFEKEMTAEETRCTALGGPYCEFRIMKTD